MEPGDAVGTVVGDSGARPMTDPRNTSMEDTIAVMMVHQMAKRAYHAYGEIVEFKNFMGDPMPEFDKLPQKIMQAWYAAVMQVVADADE